ncbi:hypothetical protein G7Y89_g13217 [Cudoniella acicularis]|uniref:SMP-30/Gluconolactonase/LRE-like region domain-containing protein n=1 Tax=Cudoniella acicularis TaxID=354080 RepID=A0A8H4R9Z9_9HELO|nr:hypothetical protein G7Y89_g13217 [Cudoniella acicularis]
MTSFILTSFLALTGFTQLSSSTLTYPRQNNGSGSVATKCGPNTANIICIDRYGSVLPPSFSRDSDPSVGYTGTVVPDDPSWSLVAAADFVVFDQERGLELLGGAPKITKVFDVLNVIHEGPVYVPSENKLYVQQDGPPGNVSQLVIDLNVDPPTMSTFQTSPPTYQPNGGVYHDGKIYWTVMGNNVSLPGGVKQRPGIAVMDPATRKVETLLNNYYGFMFSGPNDLAIDTNGDIWFTDSDYAFGLFLDDVPKQTQLATYRFRPSTGQVTVVEDTLDHPNGIAFSPDGKTLYITDSGLESVGTNATEGQGNFYNYPIAINFISTDKRNIYAYDVVGGDNPYLINKRVIWQALEGAPDGLKVAENGYLVVAAGLAPGCDILDANGTPLARIQTKHAVENIAWTGENLTTLWLVGISGMTKVDFALKGPALD